MRLTVAGDSPAVDDQEWPRAVFWMSEFLLGGMAKNLSVRLNLLTRISGFHGYITCNDWRTRRDFTVYIETGRAGRRSQLYSLGHELIHMRQIVMGQLSRKDSNFLWRGDRHIGQEEPWEVEAYELERPLYNLYQEAIHHRR